MPGITDLKLEHDEEVFDDPQTELPIPGFVLLQPLHSSGHITCMLSVNFQVCPQEENILTRVSTRL